MLLVVLEIYPSVKCFFNIEFILGNNTDLKWDKLFYLLPKCW